MKKIIFVLTLLFVLCIRHGSAAIPIGPTMIGQDEKDKIISLMNYARSSVKPCAADIKVVLWDSALEAQMNLHRDLINYPPLFLQAANLSGTYSYLFHDNCQSTSMSVSGLFSFRIQQKGCFDYSQCDPTAQNGYMSCFHAGQTGNCNNWWDYYPVIIQSNIETIACVLFGYPGHHAPKSQDNQFTCYGRINNTDMTIQPNVPYKEGAPCTACPSSYSNCSSKLCTP